MPVLLRKILGAAAGLSLSVFQVAVCLWVILFFSAIFLCFHVSLERLSHHYEYYWNVFEWGSLMDFLLFFPRVVGISIIGTIIFLFESSAKELAYPLLVSASLCCISAVLHGTEKSWHVLLKWRRHIMLLASLIVSLAVVAMMTSDVHFISVVPLAGMLTGWLAQTMTAAIVRHSVNLALLDIGPADQ